MNRVLNHSWAPPFANIKGYSFMLSILMVGIAASGPAQTTDTIILQFDDYLKQVIEHHPVARQAHLQAEMGEAAVLKARGNF
ncbi:MAG: hypothetical protein U5L96_07285 [Owenweeksia sp.]|nr:hypothetical protein [Owenweeksia sp.]